LGKESSVRRDTTRAYFAAQVGNSILGGGFSSRLVERVRTREGLAYGASSFWTIPPGGAGVIGAMTRTRGERTVEALEVLTDVLQESRGAAPDATEIATVVDQVVHGFVFGFETPDVVVSRRMSLRSQGLPADWPERYVAGIESVEAGDVASVTAAELLPERMVVLVVGDPDLFDEDALAERGPVQVWRLDEDAPPGVIPSGRRGSRRSPP
jgi:zinc protease